MSVGKYTIDEYMDMILNKNKNMIGGNTDDDNEMDIDEYLTTILNKSSGAYQTGGNDTGWEGNDTTADEYLMAILNTV